MEEPAMNSNARSFTSSEIAEMTSNFKTIIGKGGFGQVYFGTMNNGTNVAVKVLLSVSSEQHRKTFQAEVKLLTNTHHKNLVSLVGYCDEDGSKALIYDHMANGNLKQNLFEKSERILSWNERLQIALNVAHGLDYLHGRKRPIIHRDLKPENILFNTYMEAKIADFGLSRAFPTESASHISTDPAGTFGYLDPESLTGHINKKNDLYSFGIILLELVSGKPAVIRRGNKDAINIINWIDPLIKRGDIRSIVDRRLNGEFHIKAARGAINIAMSCVMKPITKRPDISHVVAKLKKCLDIEMRSTMVNGTGWFSWLCRIYKNLTEGQKGTKGSNMQLDGAEINNPQPQPLPTASSSPLQIRNDTSEDKGGLNMTEPGQSFEAKNPSFSSGADDEIIESDVELDNTDVVEPDNDPPQEVFVEMFDLMSNTSVEVTEENRDAAQSEMLKAVDVISEGKLGEAIDYLTKAIMLNPISDILYATRASVFIKLNKPNAAIRDANAVLEINYGSAKGYKIRGIANAMLGRWEEAAYDLHIATNFDYDEEIDSVFKKVKLNLQKIEEHRMKYERLWKEREIKRAVKPIKISFSDL